MDAYVYLQVAPGKVPSVLTQLAGRAGLRKALAVFGLESLTTEDDAPPEVLALAEQRVGARMSKDFDEADRLRGEVEAAGWDVRDEADGFRLVRRR